MKTQQTPATLNDVRLAIFRQHTQIAQLTDELETHAIAIVTEGGDRRAPSHALNESLDLLSTHFVRHLDYEEAHLAKWVPARGTARDSEPSLFGDHADQRCRLRGLLHDRNVFGDQRTVAREVLAFVHHLRKDMADEDLQVRRLG